MEYLFSLIASAVALYLGAMVLEGVKVKGFLQAVVVVLVIAVLNITVGTVLKIFTLGILSWGIFNWLLDAILILIADYFLDNFKVKNFWWALILAALVCIIEGALRFLF